LAALRRTEMAEAGRRLGLPAGALRWAGFEDGTLTEREDDLADYLIALLAEVRPQEVYTTCADEPHPDHSALGRAARRAAKADALLSVEVTQDRPTAQSADPPRVLEYPVWLWGSWPLRRGARMRSTMDALGLIAGRRVTKVRTGEHLAGKLHALQAHDSQLRRPSAVPADQEWPVLPPPLLAAASDTVELFLPWRPA
jgi:LmbE family N-acetylglucosaminyl deacetylase